MDYRIRAAQSTSPDATAFAELANMASHNVFEELIGPDYQREAASWFARDDHLFCHRFTHFAVAAETIVGVLCSFSGEHKAALNPQTDKLILNSASPEGLEAIAHMEPMLSFTDQLPIHAWYVQFLAVPPSARGHGVAAQLLTFAEDLARDHGAKTLELDVETDNAPALRAYRRHGLEVVATSPTVRVEGQDRSIAMHRMVKELATNPS